MGYEPSVTEFFAFMSMAIVGACLLAFFGSGFIWDYMQRKGALWAKKSVVGRRVSHKHIPSNEKFAKAR